MKPTRAAENILTIADFKARASEVVRKIASRSAASRPEPKLARLSG
jgi:hypothetical protein